MTYTSFSWVRMTSSPVLTHLYASCVREGRGTKIVNIPIEESLSSSDDGEDVSMMHLGSRGTFIRILVIEVPDGCVRPSNVQLPRLSDSRVRAVRLHNTRLDARKYLAGTLTDEKCTCRSITLLTPYGASFLVEANHRYHSWGLSGT